MSGFHKIQIYIYVHFIRISGFKLEPVSLEPLKERYSLYISSDVYDFKDLTTKVVSTRFLYVYISQEDRLQVRTRVSGPLVSHQMLFPNVG